MLALSKVSHVSANTVKSLRGGHTTSISYKCLPYKWINKKLMTSNKQFHAVNYNT